MTSAPIHAVLDPPKRVATRLSLPIEGMTCASCVGRVERALKAVPGVTEAADTCDGLDERAAPATGMPPDVPALKMFYLYLSAGCNLCCRQCWITPTFVHGKPVPAECLDFELLKGAVAEAKPMGEKAES